MKRLSFFVAACLLMAATSVFADTDANFVKLSPPQPTTANPGQVEVVEFFWYGCPHCFALEPHLVEWLKHKPSYVKFVRIPAILGPSWAVQARAYYTAQVLGILGKIHEPIFNEIHVNHDFLNTEDKFADFFSKYGVSTQDFHATYNSFAVDTKVREAKTTLEHYAVLGVPTIAVDGKFRVDIHRGESWGEFLGVVSRLVKTEHKAMAAAH